jgi:hypothetical protein
MAYTDKTFYTEQYLKDEDNLVTQKQIFSRNPEQILFYELEPAVVLDVIRDETHPILSKNKVSPDEVPLTYAGKIHSNDDPDNSYIGRALVRMCFSEQEAEGPKLNWAIPMENGIKELPLINEVVIVASYFGSYYYTRKLNLRNFLNHDANYDSEINFGNSANANYDSNKDLLASFSPEHKQEPGLKVGYLGHYFKENHKVRQLKHYEGDSIIEGRCGNSIRFGCFVNDKAIDVSDNHPVYQDGHGNPMILIRNKQRPLNKDGPENLFQSTILEDVNVDGSSIQITSGLTESAYKIVCQKKLYPGEEQKDFESSAPAFPKLIGNQVVINTDRLIFSSRGAETFCFSKGRYSIVTDDIYTLDAQNKIVITTNSDYNLRAHSSIFVKTHDTTSWFSQKSILFETQENTTWNSKKAVLHRTKESHTITAKEKIVFNSPKIFIGKDEEDGEPVILGTQMQLWLQEMIDFLLGHVHQGVHGQTSPPIAAFPGGMNDLSQKLDTIISKKVWVSGGGNSPGWDGG